MDFGGDDPLISPIDLALTVVTLGLAAWVFFVMFAPRGGQPAIWYPVGILLLALCQATRFKWGLRGLGGISLVMHGILLGASRIAGEMAGIMQTTPGTPAKESFAAATIPLGLLMVVSLVTIIRSFDVLGPETRGDFSAE